MLILSDFSALPGQGGAVAGWLLALSRLSERFVAIIGVLCGSRFSALCDGKGEDLVIGNEKAVQLVGGRGILIVGRDVCVVKVVGLLGLCGLSVLLKRFGLSSRGCMAVGCERVAKIVS